MSTLRFSGPAAVLLLVAAVGVGCSSFRHDARAARKTTPPAGSVEGLWEGRWSDAAKPEHGGRMQLVLTRTGEGLYRASARSHYWRFLTSAYSTMLVLTPISPGEFHVQGGKDLWAIGSYAMEGRVNPTNFQARFTVEKHAGLMNLHRPSAASPE